MTMTYVRMLWDMQGGRFDGQRWPGYLKEIDVPDWEAADLISGGIAEPVEAPVLNRGFDVLKAADPDYESGLKPADGEEPTAISDYDIDNAGPVLVVGDDDFNDDFADSDEDSEAGEVTPQVKRPTVVDNKAAWVEYAVSKGADREKASAKTKAMLISDY